MSVAQLRPSENAKPAYLLTAEQLASRWQVPVSQVYRLSRAGLLEPVRLGRYYRYSLTAIETFEVAGGTEERRAA